MLRRFEAYSFKPRVTPDEIDELAGVLVRTGRYLPEVLASAVGRNTSAVPVDLVWEHAYDSPAAYDRYMHHPYHICVLDRFLLPESPECLTASRRELRCGLFGYDLDGAAVVDDAAWRRIVLLQASGAADPARVPDALLALEGERGAGLVGSVVAPNTMGLTWYPDGWTHVWEQAFAEVSALEAFAARDAERFAGSPFSQRIELRYAVERDHG